MKLIDVRCRLTSKEAASYFVTQAKNFGSNIPALDDGTVEGFFRSLDEAGVQTAVSVSGNSPGMQIGKWALPNRTTSNDHMAEVQKKYPGRFIGVAGIDAGNQFHNAVEEIERSHALGLRAVFIEPGRSPGCNLNDRRLYPIYQKCAEHNMTLVPQTSGFLGGKNVDYANPKHLEQVAEDFPDLRIVAGHACYPYVRQMIVVASRRPNVWCSPDIYLFYPGTEDWLKAVNDNIQGFQDKFLFGSAYPILPLKGIVDQFMALPWNDAAKDKIMYRNALKAFDLESDPAFVKLYGPA